VVRDWEQGIGRREAVVNKSIHQLTTVFGEF
jgi:hypothetical protein